MKLKILALVLLVCNIAKAIIKEELLYTMVA